MTLTSISLTTINNHFKSFKAQTFNFHLFCFHYTPTKLHFFSFSFHFHLKPLRTFIFIDPILYFGDFHQKNRQKVFFCSCSKFGRWFFFKWAYTEKCNYLHGFRYYLNIFRNSRLFCMSTHIYRLTKRLLVNAQVSFTIDQTYIFAMQPLLEFYVFIVENKKKYERLTKKSTYKRLVLDLTKILIFNSRLHRKSIRGQFCIWPEFWFFL